MSRNKILALIIAVIVVVAAIIGVWYFYFAELAQEVPTIKIGFIADLTGPFAEGGARHKALLEAYVQKMNVEGGLYIKEYGRKLKVELIVVNYEGKGERAVELAPMLITESKVLGIIPDMSPAEGVPVGLICERERMVCFVPGPLEMFTGSAPEGGWKYSWDLYPPIADLGRLDIGFLKRFEKDLGEVIIGTLLRDDVDGRTVQKVNIPMFEGAGFKVVDPGLFPPDTQDFFPIISKFREAGVNVVFVNCFVTDFAIFWRQCHMVGWIPKIVQGGRYLTRGPADAKIIGEDIAEGLSATIWWWWNWPFPINDWIREKWSEITQLAPSVSAGQRLAMLIVLLDAIERAGKLDVEAINEALGKTDMLTPVGRVTMNATTHTARTPSLMAQLQKVEGKYDMVPIFVLDPAFGIHEQPAIFPLPGAR
jgi:branched-chain amino acid transport system substrate-binding protein